MKIKIAHNTFLKNENEMSSNLSSTELIEISKGNELNVEKIEDAGKNHKKITATFYVYTPHVQVEETTLSKEGLELLKKHEGFRSSAYLCPAGVWTIGYGSTFYEDGRKVSPGDKISEEEATRLLIKVAKDFEREILERVKVPLNSNQLSALVSFVYNIGVGAFSSSTLLRVLNQGNYQEASKQLLRWNKGGGRVLPGLVTRRKEEKQLFES